MLKACSKCGVDKPPEDFGSITSPSGKVYVRNVCTKCRRRQIVTARAGNPKYARKRALRYAWQNACINLLQRIAPSVCCPELAKAVLLPTDKNLETIIRFRNDQSSNSVSKPVEADSVMSGLSSTQLSESTDTSDDNSTDISTGA